MITVIINIMMTVISKLSINFFNKENYIMIANDILYNTTTEELMKKLTDYFTSFINNENEQKTSVNLDNNENLNEMSKNTANDNTRINNIYNETNDKTVTDADILEDNIVMNSNENVEGGVDATKMVENMVGGNAKDNDKKEETIESKNEELNEELKNDELKNDELKNDELKNEELNEDYDIEETINIMSSTSSLSEESDSFSEEYEYENNNDNEEQNYIAKHVKTIDSADKIIRELNENRTTLTGGKSLNNSKNASKKKAILTDMYPYIIRS